MARSWLVLITLAGGCGGGESGGDDAPDASSCDPSVRTYDVPALTPPSVIHTEIDPADVNSAATAYAASQHQVYLPDDPEVTVRDELFVMLPGTDNLAQGFSTIAMIAARAGYPVITLAYESRTHPEGLCSNLTGDEEIACRTGVWTEKAYGTEATAEYPGDVPNSINTRLLELLQFIDGMYPSAGADRFYDAGGVRWDRIALAGFSQGSVLAGFIGKDHALARLIVLAGGCDATGDSGTADRTLLPYCFDPRATPPERTWAISHVDDDANADQLSAEAFGLFDLGPYAIASTESPSYCSGTHAIQSHEPTRAHLSVALDGFIPLDGDGVPVLGEDYYYAFTAE